MKDKTLRKYFLVIIISVAFGYFWAYKTYTPYINQLEQEILYLQNNY